MRESHYQARLIPRIRKRFPGCVVLKNDANYVQGFPDLMVLIGPFWAALEVKGTSSEPFQPNQEYYIRKLSEMSFAAVICPENEKEVLNAIQHASGYSGQACVLVPEQLSLD